VFIAGKHITKQNKREAANNITPTSHHLKRKMRFFTRLLDKAISSNNKKILGRWNIDYCNEKTNRKIDWSNVDHCGPCGLVEAVNKTTANPVGEKRTNK
jgi:hypothetical protein